MNNDETQDKDTSVNESTVEGEAVEKENPDDSGDDKDFQELYQNQKIRAEKAESERKELEARLKELQPATEPQKKDEHLQKTDELDYGKKAYLVANGIKGKDETEFVHEWVKRTGDDLETALSDDIFQARLDKLRENRATKEATPKGTRRSTQGARDDVSYWVEKVNSGQAKLSDIEDISLKRKVLNARVEKERIGNRFSSNPVNFG